MDSRSLRDKSDRVFPRKFLKLIFNKRILRRGLALEVRCIPSRPQGPVVRRFYKSVSDFEESWETTLALCRQRYNIHFAVLPRDRRNNYKLSERFLLTCLWVDIDIGKGKAHKSTKHALRQLARFGLKPTIVIQSGHGIHAYWCLKKPIVVDSETAKRLLRAIASITGGDLQSAEPARLLRLPGTSNWKDTRNPKSCRIIRLKGTRRYRLRDLRQ
jgi:hypothetical protein